MMRGVEFIFEMQKEEKDAVADILISLKANIQEGGRKAENIYTYSKESEMDKRTKTE